MTNETPKKSVGKTLRSINAIQLKRLEKLISHFKKRDKRLVYIDAKVHADDLEKVWLTFLECSDAKNPKIIRNPDKLSMQCGRNYGKSYTADFAASLDEHSVLDLFQKAS